MEFEKIKCLVEVEIVNEFEEVDDIVFIDENEDGDVVFEDIKIKEVIEVEEIKVVIKLIMLSRRFKVKILIELLQELEKMQVNFKFN